MPRKLLALAALLLASSLLLGQDNAAKPIAKEDLRYDGKSFAEWRRYLLTELKPERQAEALEAWPPSA